MAALREVFASFGIEFDREGRVPAGERRVSAMTTSMRRLGTLIGGALVVNGIRRMTSTLLDQADAMAKSAQQTGLTTREYQAFAHAAELAGVDAQAFGTAMGQLQRNAASAAQDGGSVAESFARIGVSVTDANGEVVGGAELMRRMADGLQATENPTLRTAAAMELMGRSGRRLLPMLSGGRASVDAMASELEALGGGFSPEFAARAEQINDDMTRFRLAMTSIKSTILLQFLPSATRGVQALTRWSASIAGNDQALSLLTGGMKLLGIAAAAAAAKAALSWLAAGWPILVVVLFVALLALAVEDLWVTWKGGDSVLRGLINEVWPGMVNGITSTDQAIYGLVAAFSMLVANGVSAGMFLNGVFASIGNSVALVYRGISAINAALGSLAGGESMDAASGEVRRIMYGRNRAGRTVQGEQRIANEQMTQGIAGFRLDPRRGGLRTPMALAIQQSILPARFSQQIAKSARQTAMPASRVDARQTVTVTVNEATDAAETERRIAYAIKRENEKQARLLAANLVPAGGET